MCSRRTSTDVCVWIAAMCVARQSTAKPAGGRKAGVRDAKAGTCAMWQDHAPLKIVVEMASPQRVYTLESPVMGLYIRFCSLRKRLPVGPVAHARGAMDELAAAAEVDAIATLGADEDVPMLDVTTATVSTANVP